MTNTIRALCLAIGLTGMSACAPSQVPDMTEARERLARSGPAAVLFIGNSFSWGIPRELDELLRERNIAMRHEVVAHGGWWLAQHAKDEKTMARIREGKWDVVVLQEQSRLLSLTAPERLMHTAPGLEKLVKEIRTAGAVPVLVQTWGYRNGDPGKKGDTFEAMTQRLLEGTRSEAARAGIAVIEAGEAWAREIAKGRAGELFQKDAKHPTRLGNRTTAAACLDAWFPHPATR